MKIAPLLALGLIVLFPSWALADDGLTPLAADGDWLAVSHAQSVEDPPDICLASSISAYGFFLRVDDQGDIDLRLSDESWSLPADVTGDIKLKVNGHSYSYEIQNNTSQMVDAPLTLDQLTTLVADLEAANSLEVVAGSSQPKTIPLDGSKSVLTAFMTCAGIPNPSSNTGGSNPFSPSK